MPLLRWIPPALCLAVLLAPAATFAADPQPTLRPDWRATHGITEALLKDPGYRAIKEHYPDDYARISAALEELVAAGAPTTGAAATLRNEVQALMMHKLAAASDEAVVRMTRGLVAAMEAVGQTDPEACHGLLLGDANVSDAAMATLPEDLLNELQQGTVEVIASSRLAPRTVPAEEEVAGDMLAVLAPTFEKYGDQIDRLGAADATPAERAVACRIAVDSVRAVLTLPPERAGPILRLMYSEEELETPTED